MDTRETPSPALLKPATLAAQLGVSRPWLYDAAKSGRIPSIRIGGEDGLLRFVPEDIERWLDETRAQSRPGRANPVGRLSGYLSSLRGRGRSGGPRGRLPAGDLDSSAVQEAHHRVVEQWMGQPTQTLEDLLREELRAVCVAINPAPASVLAGHYYQGKMGRTFYSRLRRAGVLPPGRGGWQDDEAFAAGVGFTDLVKRPTEKASDVRPEEFEHGQALLEEKIRRYRPGLVIFTFKQAARQLFGSFPGNGFIPGLQIERTDVFVMPGPFESASTADATLSQLAAHVGTSPATGAPRATHRADAC